jgi:hypothetical protein
MYSVIVFQEQLFLEGENPTESKYTPLNKRYTVNLKRKPSNFRRDIMAVYRPTSLVELVMTPEELAASISPIWERDLDRPIQITIEEIERKFGYPVQIVCSRP